MRALLIIGFLLFGLESFSQDQIKNPYVVINGKYGDEISMSKSELKYWESIHTNDGEMFRVTSFDLVLVVNNIDIRLHSKTHKLTLEMKKYLEKGSQINSMKVEKVAITVTDGTVRQIEGPSIKIK